MNYSNYLSSLLTLSASDLKRTILLLEWKDLSSVLSHRDVCNNNILHRFMGVKRWEIMEIVVDVYKEYSDDDEDNNKETIDLLKYRSLFINLLFQDNNYGISPYLLMLYSSHLYNIYKLLLNFINPSLTIYNNLLLQLESFNSNNIENITCFYCNSIIYSTYFVISSKIKCISCNLNDDVSFHLLLQHKETLIIPSNIYNYINTFINYCGYELIFSINNNGFQCFKINSINEYVENESYESYRNIISTDNSIDLEEESYRQQLPIIPKLNGLSADIANAGCYLNLAEDLKHYESPISPLNTNLDISATLEDDDILNFSAYSPERINPIEGFLLNIFAYLDEQYDKMHKLATSTGDICKANKCGLLVKRRSELTFVLVKNQHFECEDNKQSLIWLGNCSNIEFFIVPNDSLLTVNAGTSIFLICQIFIKEKKLCELRIKLIIDGSKPSTFANVSHYYSSLIAPISTPPLINSNLTSLGSESLINYIPLHSNKLIVSINVIDNLFLLYSDHDILQVKQWSREYNQVTSESIKFTSISSGDESLKYSEDKFDNNEFWINASTLVLFWSLQASTDEVFLSCWKFALKHRGSDFIQVVLTISDVELPQLPLELDICVKNSLCCFSNSFFTSVRSRSTMSMDSYFSPLSDSNKLNKIVPKERQLHNDELILGELLAIGNSSKVYKAKFRGGDAVIKKIEFNSKYVQNRLDFQNDFIDLFLNEVTISSKLSNHANVVQFYGCLFLNSEVWLVTEYIPGRSLRQILDTKSLTSSEQISVTIQIAAGLWHLHSANVIHHDLSARNIFCDEFKNIFKIGDFGLSRHFKSPSPEHDDTEIKNLKDNYFAIAWMPPEALRGKINERSDIYSLGIVIYELLTRKVPFDDVPHDLELANKIAAGLKPILTLNEYNKVLHSLYENCTKFEIAERPAAKYIYNSLNEIS